MVMRAYADRAAWTQGGAHHRQRRLFQLDRTVAEYNRLIWHLESP